MFSEGQKNIIESERREREIKEDMKNSVNNILKIKFPNIYKLNFFNSR
jgi:predicted RNA-binding protein with PUA domain